MNPKTTLGQSKPSAQGGFWWLAAVLGGALGVLFFQSFDWDMALHSNDGPLGAQMNQSNALPGGFMGIWNNLYWLGMPAGSYFPNITGALLFLGPHGYINFGAPIALFLLGASAWLFFRTLGFGAMASVLGGAAMALNGNLFSNACWGLISRALSLAPIFLAMAALTSASRGRAGVKTVLAGLAVGFSITEGGDNGALFSLYVAAFAFYLKFIENGPAPARLARGAGTVLVVAVAAGVLAAQSLSVFSSLALKNKGVVQEMQSKAERWDWATQWSLCKAETLRTVIPGVFGYRLDTPGGGNYWGRVGQTPGWAENRDDPEWQRTHPSVNTRHSGAGEFTGVLVILGALWALAHAAAKNSGVYSPLERKMIGFWGAAAALSVLLSWGRFAPFYQFVYALPYVSTIRNPMKFMHEFHIGMVVLFAYGLQGLSRLYLDTTKARATSAFAGLGAWLSRARDYEKRWVWGAGAALGLSILAWLVTSGSQADLAAYISGMVPEAPPGSPLAAAMARFAAREIGVFVLFLAASIAVVGLIQTGILAGARARWAAPLLGALMLVDFHRANTPWILYEYIPHKYAANPVIDILRNNGQPWQWRVSAPAYGGLGGQAGQDQRDFLGIYHTWWLQYNFKYYNIQAIEVSQMPREVDYYFPFNRALMASPVRLWQLCNTRFILAHAAFAQGLNDQFDPVKRRFRIRAPFALTQLSPNNYSAVPTSNGPLALIEFDGALPRAKLYSSWQVLPGDEDTLKRLASPEFDPAQTVLVAGDIAPGASPAAPGSPGTAGILKYTPRRIELKTASKAAAVLLFNDRYDPLWSVVVDGKPAPLLRCNYVMRGVQVPPGDHTVVFEYQARASGFFLTLGAVVCGLVLCAWLVVAEARDRRASRRGVPRPA